jgi:cobalt-zinc-cadmium efflux system membrane fusion protein
MSEEQPSTGVLSWVARNLGTGIVVCLLAGLYLWGAANEWRPPFSPAEGEKKEEEAKVPEGLTVFPPLEMKLEDEESASLAGIELAPVRRAEVVDVVEAPAELAWEQTRLAHLAPRLAGPVFRVSCRLGQKVEKGQALLYVASAEVGKMKADLLSAAVAHDVKKKALEALERAGMAIPERQLREATQAAREARVALVNAQQALANLGLTLPLEQLARWSDDELAARIHRLGLPEMEEGLPATLLPVVAPMAGTVVRLDAVAGEVAEASKPLVALADTRQVWCLLDVKQEDVPRLALGMPVTFTGRTGIVGEGALTWISPEVDPKSRTVRVRAELPNPRGELRPGAFGTARVRVGKRVALLAPRAAVQHDGRSWRVFLGRGKQTFEPRMVLKGPAFGAEVEVGSPEPLFAASLAGCPGWLAVGLAGLGHLASPLPGGEVAAVGSHSLLGEMLKSRLEAE